MKNNEFKALLTSIKADVENAANTKELRAINEQINAIRSNGSLTDKQYEKAMELYADERGEWSCAHRKGGLTYDEFMTLAENNYNRGGDEYVECWDMTTFDDFVAECGKITKKSALAMFARTFDEEREAQAMSAWDREPVMLSDADVEQILNGYRADLAKAETIKACQDLNKLMHNLYEGAKAVPASMITAFDEIARERADALIAHETAVKMADTKKGGKQNMETKKNPAAQTAETTAPVEVLKGEVIDTKTEKQVTAAIERISAKVEKIGKGYLEIVGDVARLRALKAWKITGHKSMYDLCADKFGMSRATVGNLEAIFARYGNKETFKLTDEAEGLSVRQMLANIKSEKTAELEDKNGEPADGEGAGAGKGEKKGKIETLTSISFEISAEWSIDEMLEELKAQLTEQGAAYPDGATLTLTITK